MVGAGSTKTDVAAVLVEGGEVEEWEKSSMDKGRLSLRPSATGMGTSHMLTEKPYIGEARAMPLASRVGEKAGDHHPILYIFRTCSLPCLHTTPDLIQKLLRVVCHSIRFASQP